MAQVLDALDYSHKQGVIHRDIKPANIFILADGTAKVADFGIARIESSTLTQVGDVLGTPAYMSPEQIMGLPVDGRSDLFSAGVLLYQFLTGERPFAGSANTTMQKVLKEEPLPPSSLNVQLPAAMDAVVRKALAKKPAERFQSAQEFADALRAASADDPDATVRAVPGPARAAGSAPPGGRTLGGPGDARHAEEVAGHGDRRRRRRAGTRRRGRGVDDVAAGQRRRTRRRAGTGDACDRRECGARRPRRQPAACDRRTVGPRPGRTGGHRGA